MKIADFSTAIASALTDYSEEISEKTFQAARRRARELRKKVAEGSPEKSGEYRKGWKTEKKTGTITGRTIFLVSNKNYRLPHLLEHGHALKQGGRTTGSVRAFPHINKNAEIAQKAYEKDVEELIKNAQK